MRQSLSSALAVGDSIGVEPRLVAMWAATDSVRAGTRPMTHAPMLFLEGWNLLIFAAAAYIAVMSLVWLMRARHRGQLAKFRRQMAEERRRKKAEEQRKRAEERRRQRKRPQRSAQEKKQPAVSG